MYEPTYLTPPRLLFAVQAASERVAYRRRRLADAARDLDHAIEQATDVGATEDELVAYGLTRDRAREAIRHAA